MPTEQENPEMIFKHDDDKQWYAVGVKSPMNELRVRKAQNGFIITHLGNEFVCLTHADLNKLMRDLLK